MIITMDVLKIAEEISDPTTIITSIYWLEPEEGSDRFIVNGLSFDELKQIQTWVKNQAKSEYGITIPSIRVSKVKSSEVHPAIFRIPIEDFAASIRYDTGEGIYAEDNPIFLNHGIIRS